MFIQGVDAAQNAIGSSLITVSPTAVVEITALITPDCFAEHTTDISQNVNTERRLWTTIERNWSSTPHVSYNLPAI